MSKRGENIYKRKDGRWEARIKKADGQYAYVYGKTYSEAKIKKIEKIKNTAEANEADSYTSQNKLEMLENWLNECASRVKLSTYENYFYCIKTYVLPYFEKTKTKPLSKPELEGFSAYIRNIPSLSYAYQYKILTVLKVAIRSSITDEHLKKTFLDAIRLPKIPAKMIQVFSVEEQKKIEKTLLSDECLKSVCILLCFYTGLRLGELGALKWKDIDLTSNTLTIRATLSRKKNFGAGESKTVLYISSPKNRSSQRQIPIPDFLNEILKKYEIPNHVEYYLLSGKKTPMDTRSLQKYYVNILKASGIEHRKFHTIRHTFVTRALEMGVDIKTVSELIGHASVTNTLNIYAHSLMEQKKKAIEKLNAMHCLQMTGTPSDTISGTSSPR